MKTIPLRFINTNPKALNDSVNFSIRDIQEVMSGKDLIQDIHRHDFFFMLALKKGKGTHIIDFTSYNVNNHSIYFMRPGQVHQMVLNAGSAGYMMQFKKDFFSSYDKESQLLLRKASSNNFHQPDAESFNKVISLLNDISEESTNKKENYTKAIRADLDVIFIELIRQQKTGGNDTNKNKKLKQDRLEEFSELLDLHISSKKQTSQYAQMLNLTPYQLNAITKTVSGKMSSELINEHIILESKRYLLSTSNQVKEIAYHLGYEDVSYFIRFFKKHTGFSPEAFRESFK